MDTRDTFSSSLSLPNFTLSMCGCPTDECNFYTSSTSIFPSSTHYSTAGPFPPSQRPVLPVFSVCRKLAWASPCLERNSSIPGGFWTPLLSFGSCDVSRALPICCILPVWGLYIRAFPSFTSKGSKGHFSPWSPWLQDLQCGTCGVFSSFGSQVLWHHCGVIWVPKAKPAERHFLISSMERLWWGSILRRKYQCFSKFIRQPLPHPTSDCRPSRHYPVTLLIFGLQCWGAVRGGCSLGKGSQEPRLITRHQCISSRACWTHCAVPWPGRKITY